MIDYFLKGMLIGLIFGLPIGAIGAIVVQRIWSFDIKAGLVTGLGSSVADCIYATIGVFGFTLISDILLRYQVVIHAIGGSLILVMGIRLLLEPVKAVLSPVSVMGSIKQFLSSFVIGITNPTVILTFLFAFSYFNITATTKLEEGIALVGGVFIGTFLWWGAISLVTLSVKQKITNFDLSNINKLFGSVLTLFGSIVFVQTFFK